MRLHNTLNQSTQRIEPAVQNATTWCWTASTVFWAGSSLRPVTIFLLFSIISCLSPRLKIANKCGRWSVAAFATFREEIKRRGVMYSLDSMSSSDPSAGSCTHTPTLKCGHIRPQIEVGYICDIIAVFLEAWAYVPVCHPTAVSKSLDQTKRDFRYPYGQPGCQKQRSIQ